MSIYTYVKDNCFACAKSLCSWYDEEKYCGYCSEYGSAKDIVTAEKIREAKCILCHGSFLIIETVIPIKVSVFDITEIKSEVKFMHTRCRYGKGNSV